MGVMEQRLTNILILPAFPLMLIGSTILIVVRVGWIGLVAIGTVGILIVISKMVSAKGSQIVNKTYGCKDRRVEKTTELIEGIKPIKLYGWEIPFSGMIANLREKEISGLKKLNFIRAFERTIGSSITIICSLVIVALAIQFHNGLSFSQIFSAIEIINGLKYYIFCSVQGIGLYYEIMVVFERFANVLNIKSESMVEVSQKDNKIMKNESNGRGKEVKKQKLKLKINSSKDSPLIDEGEEKTFKRIDPNLKV